MAQKFFSLEEAADQLGISKDRLLALREANKVTGYKDGASWKFRSEAIEKLAAEGVPSIDASPSDLALNLDDEDDDFRFPADSSLDTLNPPSPSSDLELGSGRRRTCSPNQSTNRCRDSSRIGRLGSQPRRRGNGRRPRERFKPRRRR